MQFQRLDISDKASVEEFGKWAESELKTVNVLVNNAGLAPIGLQMLSVLLEEVLHSGPNKFRVQLCNEPAAPRAAVQEVLMF